MDRPESIKNQPKWIKDCAKIRARALDFLEGRQSLPETAKNLQVLAIWTHAKSDSDLEIFQRIYADLSGLPVGSEREFWAPHALAREDVKIQAVEERWRARALAAAARLVTRYAWSLDARAKLRQKGNQV
jgi:hypothetical protein